MKLHVLSDLHTEFADYKPPKTDADVVVLAGDIGVGLDGLRWAASHLTETPVVYVPGNHEYYHHDLGLMATLKANAPRNFHVLDDEEVTIDNVRFLGSELWTDFELFGEAEKWFAMQHARQAMNDFRVIKNNGAAFTAEQSIGLHRKSRRWLADRLSDSIGENTVVVTHHLPSFRSFARRFAEYLLSAAFASHLDDLMDGDRVSLWIHGHTHDSFDYVELNTRVVCNLRGYASHELNPDFRPNLVIDLVCEATEIT